MSEDRGRSGRPVVGPLRIGLALALIMSGTLLFEAWPGLFRNQWAQIVSPCRGPEDRGDGVRKIDARRIDPRGTSRREGYAGDDCLDGRGGDDVIDGRSGADHLYGGDGDDVLMSGTTDVLSSSPDGHVDVLDGGPGHDVCVVGPEDVTVSCEEVVPYSQWEAGGGLRRVP